MLGYQVPQFLQALGADKIIDDQQGTIFVMQKDDSIKGDWFYRHSTQLPESGGSASENFTVTGAGGMLSPNTVVKIGDLVLTNGTFNTMNPAFHELAIYAMIDGQSQGGGYIRDNLDGTFEFSFSYNTQIFSGDPVEIEIGEVPVESRPIWQIKRIQETTVGTVKVTTIQFPDGFKRYAFVADNYLTYNYKYSI
ncbi:MAG: hypothetical protein K5860_06650 [Bacteroidales bacterium]|nr:hypothetical protein [Bacteroidales bacterium]